MTWHLFEVSILELSWVEESLLEGWKQQQVSSDSLFYFLSMSVGVSVVGEDSCRVPACVSALPTVREVSSLVWL